MVFICTIHMYVELYHNKRIWELCNRVIILQCTNESEHIQWLIFCQFISTITIAMMVAYIVITGNSLLNMLKFHMAFLSHNNSISKLTFWQKNHTTSSTLSQTLFIKAEHLIRNFGPVLWTYVREKLKEKKIGVFISILYL